MGKINRGLSEKQDIPFFLKVDLKPFLCIMFWILFENLLTLIAIDLMLSLWLQIIVPEMSSTLAEKTSAFCKGSTFSRM